ncbi:MAG: phosphate uptake regulator PhoU [Euryarchaeota archaeon]|nr:phosphate uptake regulator PhoU [Euryarchaeota archaeon]
METRKIQRTGGSSYAISLPKQWVENNNLQSGNSLGIMENKNGTLSVAPMDHREEKKSCEITLSENLALTERTLITKYLQGYDIIKIRSKTSFDPRKREKIVSLMQNLIGIEIFEEKSNKIVFSSLIEFGSTPLEKVTSRMLTLTGSMLKDTVTLNENLNESLAKNIIQRDNEVDKLYFFALREISEASRNTNVAKALEISDNFELIPNIIAIRNIERIADYAEVMAEEMTSLEKPSKKIQKKGKKTLEMFRKTVRAFIRKDHTLANDLLEEIEMSSSKEGVESVVLSSIVSSMDAVQRHCSNIAECVINLKV